MTDPRPSTPVPDPVVASLNRARAEIVAIVQSEMSAVAVANPSMAPWHDGHNENVCAACVDRMVAVLTSADSTKEA